MEQFARTSPHCSLIRMLVGVSNVGGWWRNTVDWPHQQQEGVRVEVCPNNSLWGVLKEHRLVPVIVHTLKIDFGY